MSETPSSRSPQFSSPVTRPFTTWLAEEGQTFPGAAWMPSLVVLQCYLPIHRTVNPTVRSPISWQAL